MRLNCPLHQVQIVFHSRVIFLKLNVIAKTLFLAVLNPRNFKPSHPVPLRNRLFYHTVRNGFGVHNIAITDKNADDIVADHHRSDRFGKRVHTAFYRCRLIQFLHRFTVPLYCNLSAFCIVPSLCGTYPHWVS